jgi:hypothetical protein
MCANDMHLTSTDWAQLGLPSMTVTWQRDTIAHLTVLQPPHVHLDGGCSRFCGRCVEGGGYTCFDTVGIWSQTHSSHLASAC